MERLRAARHPAVRECTQDAIVLSASIIKIMPTSCRAFAQCPLCRLMHSAKFAGSGTALIADRCAVCPCKPVFIIVDSSTPVRSVPSKDRGIE